MFTGKTVLVLVLIATGAVAFRPNESLESWSSSHGLSDLEKPDEAQRMTLASAFPPLSQVNSFNSETVPLLNEHGLSYFESDSSRSSEAFVSMAQMNSDEAHDAFFLNHESEVADHYVAHPGQLMYNRKLEASTPARRMSASSALIGTFYPLTCNANLTLLDCSLNKTSTLIMPSSGETPFTIPCGMCYTFDLGSNVSLPTGLVVIGKLVFPVNYKTSIYTSFVLVQGEMVVRSNSSVIAPENLSVRFVLTGTSDTFIDTSNSDPNTLACNTSVCNAGKKPFIVAGGKVDIQAFPPSCMSWTKIKDTVLQNPLKNSSLFKSMVYPPPQCSSQGLALFQDSFTSFSGNWTGREGGYVYHNPIDGTMTVANRKLSWQGPHIDLTRLISASCLIPNQDYLLTARIRLDKADGTGNGTPTPCAINGTYCPRLTNRIGRLPNLDWYRGYTLPWRYAGNYGQFVDFSSTFQWNSDEADGLNNTFWTLYIEGPEPGVTVTMDYFSIALPAPSSYLNPVDVCQELLPNGNAEGNGFNPYPFASLRADEKVKVMNENGNNFFRLENRLAHWSTISYNVETRCLDLGVTYFASAKIRIQSDFPQGYYILLTVQRADNSYIDLRIVQCPPQSRFDGWVTCSGEFTIDTDLSRALSANWRLYLTNTRDGIYTVDYDDLSIKFLRGYVDKVAVDSVDSSCWGAGSDVHLTSSTFYNSDGAPIRPNGYKGKIIQVTAAGNGTQYLQISPAPTLPILSQADSSLYAAEMALLSRNVVVEGSYNEASGKGGYFQVLHTPDISQTVQGVQFLNMGRLGEFDHFALQILYSGSVTGTYIAKNSIVDSNHRGIVVEGTSNVSIFDNVAVNVSGHAFYVGDQSQSNVFERNLASQTKTMSTTLSGENDNDAAAFFSRFPPNSFISNMASGNMKHGFYFFNSGIVRTESGAKSNMGSAYSYPCGTFRNNVAHSNQNSGFALYNFLQYGNITFESSSSYKNRDNGFFLWNSRRAKVTGGIIADNRVGLEARYSENLTISNVEIRGFSNSSRTLTLPPYFWQLCPSSSAVVGYRLNTFINDGSETKGVTAKNLIFADFDATLDCPGSVSIELNSLDVTDGHFDYLSSFQNISIKDSRNFYINACRAQSVGINDIVLTDIDGSLFNHTNASSPYSVVSNVNSLTTFAANSCTLHPEMCLADCASTCLRTVEYSVEQFGTSKWALQIIKDNGDGVFDSSDSQIVVGSKYRYDGNDTSTVDNMQLESNLRKFSVSLPIGSFQAQFLDDTGAVSWPRFVQERWKSSPDCSNYVNPSNVALFEPTVGDCSNLIVNGNFENGSAYPWHRRNGVIRLLPGAGLNGSTALISKRSWIYDGVGMNLDTRCLHVYGGRFYEIKAWIRLSLNGTYVACDPNSNIEMSQCPSTTMGVTRIDNPTTKQSLSTVWQNNKARTLLPYRSDQFNLIHGVFKVDSILASAQRVYFYFEIFNRTFDLILDDVSITPFDVDSRCNGDLIRNGNFSSGTNIYWGSWGSPQMQMLYGSDYSSGYAIMTYGRTSSDWGLSQNIYCNSLVAGDRFAAIVRYKLMTNTNITFQCNRTSNNLVDSCMQVRFYTSKNGTYTYPWLGETSASLDVNGWNYATGLYVIEPNAVKADVLAIYFSNINPSLSIIYDRVSFTKIPFSCQSLVLNPSFDEGTTSFYYADDRANMKVSIITPGFGGSGFAALIYDRSSSDRSLVQNLDSRCFYPNAEYTITAKFKLLNNTGLSTGVSCDTNALSGSAQCPSIRLYGSNCVNGPTMFLTFWSLWQWNANTYNNFTKDITVSPSLATCKTFQLYLGRSVDPKVAVLVDDIQINAKTTPNPTPFPTFSPISSQASLPTISPSGRITLAPTKTAIACPLIGDGPMALSSNTVMIQFASAGVLCSMVKVTTDTTSGNITAIIPLARSYDGFVWELAAGDYAATFASADLFRCYSRGCQFSVPAKNANELFQLRSYQYNLSETDQLARMLERTSFGIMQSELTAISSLPGIFMGNVSMDAISYKMGQWVQKQMMVNVTSHREFWRQRANPRLQGPSTVGLPNQPCQIGARFRQFAFVRNDYRWDTTNSIRFSSLTSPIVLSMNGLPRTVVSNISILNSKYSNYTFNTTRDYKLCGNPDEIVGGRMYITLDDGTCQPILNPAVNFTGFENLPTYALNIPKQPNSVRTIGDEFILLQPLNDTRCSMIPDVVEVNDPPIFGLGSDGSWLQFDPRLNLEGNTMLNPIADGGGQDAVHSGKVMACSNVPRTFLNEKQCSISYSPLTCGTVSSVPDVFIKLDEPTLLTLFNLTGRYVYGLKGLTVIDRFNNMIAHPCTPGLRSRWLLKDLSTCNTTDVFNTTNLTLSDLLKKSTDTNPFFRDITFPTSATCDPLDTNPEIEILVNGKCWTRVHPEYLSVYDMTYWTYNDTHPGNLYAATRNHSNPIKKWAESGTGILVFPSKHPYDLNFDHPVTRWDESYRKFIYVGRFGDSLRLVDLPNELRKDQVLAYFGASGKMSGGGVIICGSPGEVANDQSKDSVFDVETGYETPSYYIGDNRKFVWTMLALNATDQFRQRVAWALAQILVVVKSAIGSEYQKTEWFLNYYDIFVRNAFGNYRDILREVSYSSLMAENLSYLGSKSAAYVLENYRYVAFADENFAREIMQLFTIGITKLNIDGTPKLDFQGNKMLSYTNEHVMSFARAWTGFDRQPKRGNVEGNDNRIDPMRIQASWRDRFPKSELNDGYIGDGLALCADFPSRMFLRKGASYRFLGSSSLPELMDDPAQLANDQTAKRVILNNASALRGALCNADLSGNCRYSNIVSLSSNLPCVGIECSVDTLRVVQITNSSFYEYVSPPCVQQSFFSGAVKVATTNRYDKVICENPKLPLAGAACCALGSTTSYRTGLYDIERMTLASARNRCLNQGMDLCDYDYMSYNSSQWYKVTGYHWTTVPCAIKAKINPSGYIALVHEPSNYLQKVLHVNNDSENYFKVYWKQSNYPKASNLCDGICDVVGDSCLCSTAVSSSPVYAGMPLSVSEAVTRLRIGSPDPNSFDSGTFYSFTDLITNITAYTRRQGVIEADSIFSFTNDIGMKHILKNTAETVQIRSNNGFYTGYSFRNAPHFMSFLYSETTTRDARYETEATLDHYFYQDNTAPFVSKRLIQRFVSSNPSPRYVAAVATAFRSGSYQFGGSTYGTGSYGDLAATMAAVILDREARSVTVDADPSSGFIREPLLRFTSLLRSMELTPTPSQPVVRLYKLETVIGQMAHEFTSVFSFLLPEFKPSGLIGDRGFVSPEAALLDTPKIIGLLNGAFSLINYGLSTCNGGLGPSLSGSCYEGLYNSASGLIGFNTTPENPYDKFYETFEGPSLVGGFDSRWVGRNNGAFTSVAVTDPRASSNYAVKLAVLWTGEIYSRVISLNQTISSYVVKFRYYSPGTSRGGGCIGLYDVNFGSQKLFYCDWNNLGNTTSAGSWLTCQYQIPPSLSSFRIGLHDAGGSAGDAYFDDIQVVPGNGTSCTGISLQSWTPPGRVGYSTAVVNTLASLMTAGRLSAAHRDKIRLAFDNAGSANDGLRLAQQLIVTTSEFHSANTIKSTETSRTHFSFPPPANKPYRAVVFIMFSGGCDSFNMLTPYSCTKGKDLYSEYLDVRQQVALSRLKVLEVKADNQVCESFGIHSSLKTVRQLYLDGDLSFFANTGVLTAPVTKLNYYKVTKTQLFAHDQMQLETKCVDPLQRQSNTGVLGRMTDVLTKKGHVVGSFSLDRYSVSILGQPGVSAAPMIVSSGNGVTPFYASNTLRGLIPTLHKQSQVDSGYFSEAWSNALMQSINVNELLSTALLNVSTSSVFPNTYLGQQLRTVARLIATRTKRGVDTDTFYVEIGGFDTHADVEINLVNRFTEVDSAISAFASELKNMGVWNNVTVIQTSDFARTLAPNSGDGTDHAWGGNYMMLGGDVKGGQILGSYPDDLTDAGPLGLGRGRLIPTTPWDAVFQGIAGWLSITGADLDYVCPNRYRFAPSVLFTANDLFMSGQLYGDPSVKPTKSPGSRRPSVQVSKAPTKRPTKKSSARPTVKPTAMKTKKPSSKPSNRRSQKPSAKPSKRPSRKPSAKPSKRSTRKPSLRVPTRKPSKRPTKKPSRRPSSKPL